jgi:hypothetical protein
MIIYIKDDYLQGFVEQMKDIELKTFDIKSQDLYRQIMSKRAWVNKSPTKGSDCVINFFFIIRPLFFHVSKLSG